MNFIIMPQISAMVSEDLNRRFRDKVSKEYGAYKRGSIQKAVIAALESWISGETSTSKRGSS